MKQLIIYMLLIIMVSSCTSYSRVKPKFIKSMTNTDIYNISDFNIYRFNICESYKRDINGAKRFSQCPENFFRVSVKDSIKKIEELYLLKHNTSNLIVYLTTTSHKTRPQHGFLNDSSHYNNAIYLKDVKYIYVGQMSNDSIIFKHQKDHSKLIWHTLQQSTSINVKSVNTETVENKGDSTVKIDLNTVFSVPFNFHVSPYTLFNNVNEKLPLQKLTLSKTKNNKTEAAFTTTSIHSKGYYFSPSKILYSK